MNWKELIKKLRLDHEIHLGWKQRVLLGKGLASVSVYPPYREEDIETALEIIKKSKIIPTWDSFKQYLTRRGIGLTHKEWVFLKAELEACAVHEPFDEVDVYFAIERVREMKSLLGNGQST